MTLDLTRFCFTTNDFDRMIEAGILDEGDRVELIDGEIVQMRPIGRRHAACVDRLTRVLSSLNDDTFQLRVQGPIQLGDATELQPDLAILRRSGDYYASAHPTATDIILLVEVADTSAGVDRRVKVPLYARREIEEVWLVDLEANVVTVFRDPTLTGYTTVVEVNRDSRLNSVVLREQEIEVSDVLG